MLAPFRLEPGTEVPLELRACRQRGRVVPATVGWDFNRVFGGPECGEDTFMRLCQLVAFQQRDADEWLTGIKRGPVDLPDEDDPLKQSTASDSPTIYCSST